MLQMAVFVDAGYLHAQGSALLTGSAQRRERNRLNVSLMLANLIAEARNTEPAARLLRIYWYDGVARGGVLNQEQVALSQSANVKCRFGVINSQGHQKGVDSLIVTDLVQLAREHAISDAMVLAGDEDLRVGVAVAQTFGVRVHLLGIAPGRGSQSPDLRAEADTTAEWGIEKVANWLSVITPTTPAGVGLTTYPATSGAHPQAGDDSNGDLSEDLRVVALERVGQLSAAEASALVAFIDQNGGPLPPDFDRPALGTAKLRLGRDLDFTERRAFRDLLRQALRSRAAE